LLVGLLGLAGVGLAALVRRRRAVALVCLGVTAAGVAAGVAAFAGRDRGLLTVAAVQGGGPRGFRAVDTDPDTVFAAHVAATGDVPPGSGLVLWPENVIDLNGPLAGSREEAVVADLARRLGTTIVAGVTEELSGQDRFRNAAVVWGPDGRVLDRFEKVHRVPFGEYIPFRSLLEDVADVSAVPRDAIPGKGPGVVDSPAGRLAVVISYEVFFADRARSGVRAGGRVLLVPTNASSYTTSQVPTQEVAVAQLRAVETGRWVVQSAPTGYSAVVDPHGRVRVRGPLGDASVLRHAVRLRSGQTLATRLGDAPIVAFAALGLLSAWVLSKKVEWR
jgi:apolipoprotein N-acyltransferase